MENRDYFKDTKISDKYVSFWGGVFSNFYPCKIDAEGKTFTSSEQYFMWQKARYFRDDVIEVAILDSKTPSQAKKLGRRIDGFDEEQWREVRMHAMFNAVYLKFKQNKDLMDILLDKDISDKNFVEGSPVDKIWGVGIKWDDPEIEDKENWKGENLLGIVLDTVRAVLSNEKSNN